MIFGKFLSRLRNYGPRRLFLDSDFLLAVGIWLLLVVIEIMSCRLIAQMACMSFRSPALVETGTQMAISLTGLIIVGLSVLVAFTNAHFLAELKDLGIYQNIMFVFEYTLYLTIGTGLIGILVQSYDFTGFSFYIFLLFFLYMAFAVIYLIELIVTFGNKKAKFESANSDK